MDDWFKYAFSQDYLRIYQHRNTREAEAWIDRLLTYLKLPKKAICLDLCCGFGRHLSYLNESKIRTVGLDLSSELLNRATQTKSLRNRIIQGDMQALPFNRKSFDFVFSFFSSFGYFANDRDNFKVLQQIQNVLKSKGGFMIDYLNSRNLIENLNPEDHQEFPDFVVRQRRWINKEENLVEKELIIEDGKGKRSFLERLKLYNLENFETFCKRAGLSIKQKLGNYEGEAFHNSSERLIIIGEKREG